MEFIKSFISTVALLAALVASFWLPSAYQEEFAAWLLLTFADMPPSATAQALALFGGTALLWVAPFIMFALLNKTLTGSKKAQASTTKFGRRVKGVFASIAVNAVASAIVFIACAIVTGIATDVIEDYIHLPVAGPHAPPGVRTAFAVAAGLFFLWSLIGAPRRRMASIIKRTIAGVVMVISLESARAGAGRGGSAKFAGLAEEWDAGFVRGRGILLGKSIYDGAWIGPTDDRHILTIAGTRSGKGRSLVIPNLLHYAGSALVLDFKGTNCVVTASARKKLGQGVYCVNPFAIHAGKKGMPAAARFNPLADLDPASKTFPEELDLVADALVIPGSGDSHWDDSARSFIKGVIAHVVTMSPKQATLARVRDLIAGSDIDKLLDDMTCNTSAGVIARNAAGQLRLAGDKERGSILSNAAKNLAWLDSPLMREALSASDFSLRDLKRKHTTVYLCLPPEQLGTHARFLRIFVNLTLAGVSTGGKAKVPVLLVLDEFPALGRMDRLLDAVAILAGLNVRLWPIAQDLGQLIKLYGNGWSTFWANAGQITLFAANDLATAEHASRELGRLVVHDIDRDGREVPVSNAPLRDANELQKELGRVGGRVLVFREGRNPLLLDRVLYDRDFPRSAFNADPDQK